ncbi:MAG: HIT family protein [Kiritimatiellia bacterium]|jgi:histidine triad (HIT) family protein
MQTDCVFCKIVQGTLPSTHIFEDRLSLVFLDIAPVVKGHALVIPKEHYDPITATPDAVLQHLITVARRIAAAQMVGLSADGVNIMQANGAAAGQVVPHLHFHIIPRFSNDGHSWNWQTKKYANPDEMQGLADKIRKGLA